MKLTWFVLASLLLSSSIVFADERSEAQQHYAKGKKAYELGDYDEAVAEYSTAYRLRDDPALLYNLGQAHRLANHSVEALRAYRMFLIRVPDSRYRDEVELKINELQRRVDLERKQKEAQAALVAPPPQQQQARVAAMVAPPPVADVNARRKKTIAGATLFAAGLALVGGGVAGGVLAKQSSDQLTKLDQTMQRFDSSLDRTGKTEQILEGVLLGAGGAALITGVALLVVGRREHRTRGLAFAPSIAPGAVHATLAGSF